MIKLIQSKNLHTLAIKKSLLFIALLFFALTVSSQSNTLEIGAQVGVSSCFCDVSPIKGIALKPLRAALGFSINKQFNASLGLTGSFFHTTLSGDDYLFPEDDFRIKRGFYFTTQLTEFAIYPEWTIFGKRNEHRKASFSPIFFSGPAMVLISPSPSFSRVTEDLKERIATDQTAIYKHTQLAWLMGVGMKWQPQHYFSIRAKIGIRATFTDYLDGISAAGNPETNDWYGIGNVSMSFTLTRKDSDGDGVVDAKDDCPEIAGFITLNGCPDSDGDGFADHEDDCPLLPGLPYLHGCPDADNDGITDQKDKCPLAYGPVEHFGCPYKDSDGDGLDDIEDECPHEAGPLSRGGCPEKDSDGDGVLDDKDKCPTVFGIPVFDGCPDSDGDGIQDSEDNCPHEFGVFEKKGCPLNLSTTEIVSSINRQYINFESGNYAPLSYHLLDEIANFLKKESNYRIRLNGYSDSGGERKHNIYVSRKRAKACYKYLLNKGISSYRITYTGKGEEKPIADNNTPEGRQQNRRVEFELYQK